MSKIEVDAVTQQSGTTLTVGGGSGKTLVADAATVTLGRCGGTVALASGATQTGFGRTGTVDWDTTPKTATFTAVSGDGFFANTSAGAFNMNLPAGSAGAIVSVADYAGTWQNNNLTVVPNGSDKIGGFNDNVKLKTEGQSVTFVFVDSTQGWVNVQDSTSNERGTAFVAATGGNAVVTNGDFKTHIFTGPGTFCVSCGGNPGGSNTVDYFVVAGGGGGGNDTFSTGCRGGGGAGGGGFRISNSVGCLPAPSMSPLVNPTGLPVSATGYPVTVGAGGAGGVPGGPYSGARGSDSAFAGSSTITSTGGGGGGGHGPSSGGSETPTPGGSGGGTQNPPSPTAGLGNVPPVSPPQGNPAGNAGGAPKYTAGGGGGAGAVGGNSPGPGPTTGGSGGDGSFIACSMVGPTAPSYGTPGPATGRYFAGGGGSKEVGAGGAGGGAAGSGGAAATVNTGGGGGGQRSANAGNGGSGIVMIRYKFQ